MCSAATEREPLGRAEHIVYLSAFFNMEAKALESYQSIAASYVAVATGADPAEGAPTVAWIDAHANGSSTVIVKEDGTPIGDGKALKISLAPYKVALTRDAGVPLLSLIHI